MVLILLVKLLLLDHKWIGKVFATFDSIHTVIGLKKVMTFTVFFPLLLQVLVLMPSI